ncbi:MAG TPA: Crp/Fnr family transcriptional regulator [Chitinophagales bacterium]|jgi:CRP/FNR family transcriptional regulator|nr:Crp/Fnr family transcriptional regulator [Chitinophagales bacterium]
MTNKVDFSSVFEPELVKEIFQFGDVKHFKEGDVIMDYGKYVRMMPIITKGTVKVFRMDDTGKELLLYYLTNNESCSMAYSCCLEAKKSEVRAIAEDDVELIAIPHLKLDEWLCKYPSWKNYIMHSFNERFIELLKTIDAIAFEKLDERLINYLKKKSEVFGKSALQLSHNQIAEEMGTSRVVISRLLKRLENDQKILLYRNEIKLLKAL